MSTETLTLAMKFGTADDKKKTVSPGSEGRYHGGGGERCHERHHRERRFQLRAHRETRGHRNEPQREDAVLGRSEKRGRA